MMFVLGVLVICYCNLRIGILRKLRLFVSGEVSLIVGG